MKVKICETFNFCQQRSSPILIPVLENHIRLRFFPESTESGFLGFGEVDCTGDLANDVSSLVSSEDVLHAIPEAISEVFFAEEE